MFLIYLMKNVKSRHLIDGLKTFFKHFECVVQIVCKTMKRAHRFPYLKRFVLNVFKSFQCFDENVLTTAFKHLFVSWVAIWAIILPNSATGV